MRKSHNLGYKMGILAWRKWALCQNCALIALVYDTAGCQAFLDLGLFLLLTHVFSNRFIDDGYLVY